jgi:hypothetical protein
MDHTLKTLIELLHIQKNGGQVVFLGHKNAICVTDVAHVPKEVFSFLKHHNAHIEIRTNVTSLSGFEMEIVLSQNLKQKIIFLCTLSTLISAVATQWYWWYS